MDNSKIYASVQERYGSAAKNDNPEYARNVATAFGYSSEELESIPHDANLGLSCGNPLVLANLKEGETVIDLGSGAGLDVFLAARKVGIQGKAIGIDMNKDMLKRAEANKVKTGATNVSFVESLITEIALPDETADCIISNCVVNLVPETEKQLVFNEMFRLLKSGGRVAISDTLAKKDLSPELKNSMALYVGCIAGASLVSDYERYLQEAGFRDILIVDSKSDLNIYSSNASGLEEAPECCVKPCCGSADPGLDADGKVSGLDFNVLAGAYKIYAIKP